MGIIHPVKLYQHSAASLFQCIFVWLLITVWISLENKNVNFKHKLVESDLAPQNHSSKTQIQINKDNWLKIEHILVKIS